MGASMTGIIEWTHDAQCAVSPGANFTLGQPRWSDDYLHGILFKTDKEYDFFAAIAGVRSRFSRSRLIAPRGLPESLSSPALRYFEDNGTECAGWLHQSEIDRCIRHMEADPFYTDFELDVAMDLMRTLVAKLGDAHVRLVFNIESP